MNTSPDPLVTVCITTYQHAAFIRRCISSVLDQVGAEAVEVLVGDDGSVDSTRDIAQSIADVDPRVHAIFNPTRLGPSANLSSLVARARGAFVAHLDGDDYWLPGKLAMQLDRLAKSPRSPAVYTNATVIAPDERPLGVFNRDVGTTIDGRELLRRGNFLCHSTLLYRRQAIDAVLGVSPPYIDYRLHIRLAAKGDLAYIDAPLAAYRWRSPGSMITSLPEVVLQGHVDAIVEALAQGAMPHDARRAAGRMLGRTTVHTLLGGRLGAVPELAATLRSIRGLDASRAWVAGQVLLGPLRAASSVAWRRRGVFFP
ncbi:glycosyltransferase family 2 protein [Cognatilysobacter terrigena]|uniref:glycosyltransferase family 2 protein n=1 Tax=Cognatilysobacter terrigena TaxID=2488749 RepID=UPI00105CE564|nr:glycosyltransferase [Lysobacter terrigena]